MNDSSTFWEYIYFTVNLTWCRDISVCVSCQYFKDDSALNISTVPNSVTQLLSSQADSAYEEATNLLLLIWIVFMLLHLDSDITFIGYHYISPVILWRVLSIYAIYIFRICVFASCENFQSLFLYIFEFTLQVAPETLLSYPLSTLLSLRFCSLFISLSSSSLVLSAEAFVSSFNSTSLCTVWVKALFSFNFWYIIYFSVGISYFPMLRSTCYPLWS